MTEVRKLWQSSATQKELKSGNDTSRTVAYRSAARVTAGAVTEASKPATMAEEDVAEATKNTGNNWEWSIHANAPQPTAPAASVAAPRTPSPLRRLRAAAAQSIVNDDDVGDAEVSDARMPSPLERLRATPNHLPTIDMASEAYLTVASILTPTLTSTLILIFSTNSGGSCGDPHLGKGPSGGQA